MQVYSTNASPAAPFLAIRKMYVDNENPWKGQEI